MASFIARTQRHSFGRFILENWINGLLSGFATHVTYSIANLILTMERGLVETPVAAALGALRRDQTNVVRLGEVGARVQGAVSGFIPATHAGFELFKTGVQGRLPGQEAVRPLFFQPKGAAAIEGPMLQEEATLAEAKASLYGVMRGILDGMVSIGKILEVSPPGERAVGLQYSPLGATADVRICGGVLPTGALARLPTRAIASNHTAMKAWNYSIDKHALIYRTATAKGLTGEARALEMARLQNFTPENIVQSAGESALSGTMMGQAGEFTHRLTALTNWAPNLPLFGETPLLKFIDPFVHIAANIIDQSIVQRTPVGLLSPQLRADLLSSDAATADMARARMIVGTGLALGFGVLAARGYVTGSGPMDRDKAAMWRLAGYQAHSMRIGDMWYQMNRLGPLGMLLSVSADMADVAHAASQDDMSQAAALLMRAISQNVLDENFMRGPSDFIQAVDNPGRYGERYIQNFASSFLPYSVGLAQMDRTTDPWTRQARTVMESIKQKIPGLSETLFPRRDVWGNPMPNHDALIAAGVTAIYEQRMSRDPVNIALAQLGIGIAPVDRTVRNVQLTEQQYDDFARSQGRDVEAPARRDRRLAGLAVAIRTGRQA